ncbi:MBL fold metallo-hydrolase [Halioxenophilus sp. WMMB6]|uniref:MBL fold metallo-hydrolase n=1 Tax=Halioxenophilus sp. WMMB6 TaxID=3073815 RepID=UPI00295EEB72|nr:MBL fold metallo-hydrolase [Halioxenophilus sp. WMMB6]
MSDDNKKPHLASLVQAGEGQTEAVKITDYIHMTKDISNAYLVNTSDGDVLINTGFMASTERNKKLFAPVRSGPLKYILLTQAHADHYGGVPALREAGTQVVAQQRFLETYKFFERLMPFLKGRSAKLWSGTVKGRDLPIPVFEPDITFDDHYQFELGGRRFEVIHTPGGESLDAAVVWLPKERVVFTGNLFGPVFMSMPNLCTMRGDKPRSAKLWLECLDKVRKLGADLLITGHGEPICCTNEIRQSLDTMYDAVSYIFEATLDGMNAGKDVYTLMREIQLPENLKLGEFHGKVSWAVRTIWEEHAGWFHLDYTSSMYAVPRSSVAADLVELAGGCEQLAERAASKLAAGNAVEAMHLLEVALDAEPTNPQLLTVKAQVLQQLLKESGGNNLSETMWLKTELTNTQSTLG